MKQENAYGLIQNASTYRVRLTGAPTPIARA
jgi:hypothetical protein